MKYRQLAINDPKDLLFGHAPHPLTTRHGLKIGGGLVYPELNFTLPAMEVTAATMPKVERHYRAGHASGALKIIPRELGFLDTMEAQLDELPANEDAFIEQQEVANAEKYLPAEYAL